MWRTTPTSAGPSVTLGVLRDAAAQGLVDLPTAFGSLRQTSFRAPGDVMNALLIADAKRASRQH
jgi:hypothetical protein